ncbi:hypothetical protein FACS1894217_13940 [Clostridia bacterium]|nr:hypothetical protein FACS1894217_13940 [Clostridia bacterium]
MLTSEFIKQLKQSNVSRDAEKTKERVKETYGGAGNAEKRVVVSLSGQTRNTIYRACNTGSVSAKLLLPIAQAGNVSPFWLAGDTDDKGTFDLATVKAFLESRKYTKLAATLTGAAPVKEKRAYKKRTPKVVPVEVETVEETIEEEVKPGPTFEPDIFDDEEEETATFTFDLTDQMKETVEGLTVEDASKLLSALFLRAQAGGKAAQLCEVVKYCLLA